LVSSWEGDWKKSRRGSLLRIGIVEILKFGKEIQVRWVPNWCFKL